MSQLEDQKQEAEEEMRRMRQRHDEEVAGLRTRIQVSFISYVCTSVAFV